MDDCCTYLCCTSAQSTGRDQNLPFAFVNPNTRWRCGTYVVPEFPTSPIAVPAVKSSPTSMQKTNILTDHLANIDFNAWISLGILFCFRCKSLSRNGDPSPPISSSTIFWGFSSKSTSLPFSWSASSTAESISGSLSISWNLIHMF